MALILHIETAVSSASICISKDGMLLGIAENKNQKEHADWLHSAIDKLLKKTRYLITDLQATAVSNGPGSYTGLRVGLAAAKGICFALGIPLITISTLEIMAIAALSNQSTHQLINSRLNYSVGQESIHLCPMIDARRMEVFTALYDRNLNVLITPHAKVIDETSFEKELASGKILFFGNGAAKCMGIITGSNALFETVEYDASFMIEAAEKKMIAKDFADIAYAEPFYIKDFHTAQLKK